MDIQSILIAGVPVIFLVIGLVEFAKKLGLQGNACMVLAMVLGILFMALIQLSVMFPDLAPWVKVLVIGLVLGLSAAGLYDFAKSFQKPPV